MKIFISDLHLGDGSRTDDFHRDEELLRFLDYAEDSARELIILGDLLELWQADLDKVLFCHSRIISRLLALGRKIKVIYCVGNHDYIPFAKFAGTVENICLEYRDENSGIIAEHGHQYDVFNRFQNPLQSIKWPTGKYLTLLIASLERLIHPDADLWAKQALQGLDEFLQKAMFIRNRVTPASQEYLKRGGHFGEFDQAVKKHLYSGAKVVIFGHTHKCQLNQIEGGIYANCGAWVDDVQPTYIACEEQQIALKEALTHKTIQQLTLS